MTSIRPSPVLSRIAGGNLCTGCGLCSAIVADGKITMQMSETGYLRPVQVGELSAGEDHLVAETCPGIGLLQDNAEGIDDRIWGPVLAVRTGSATNASLRHHASSGGVLSALLIFLLESKMVDYVVHTAASEASPIENAIVESVGKDGVFCAAGSRYSPSAPLAQLRRQLERPGRFALVGKPCDVAAVRAWSRHDRCIQEKIPVILSFFCAGVPSINGAREILAQLDVPEEDVVSFRFRGDGWPGFATARLKDGREARMSYARSWGGILSKHSQFRCKICPDGSGGFADIACGDAWYSDDKGYPLFEETEGRSLIVSRTRKGEDLIQRAIEAGYIAAQSLDVGEIVKMQPSQARRKQLVLARLCAMALFRRDVPRFVGLQLCKAALRASFWQNLRSFLGMARRLLRGRTDAPIGSGRRQATARTAPVDEIDPRSTLQARTVAARRISEHPTLQALRTGMFRVIDLILAIPLTASALIMKTFRKIGAHKLPACSVILETFGVWPIRRHYSEPLFHRRDITENLRMRRPLPGIDLRTEHQLQLLSKFCYRDELVALNWRQDRDEQAFHIDNRMFEGGDADMLYNFIRHFRPRCIVEIGGGHSTKVAQAALRKNLKDTGIEFRHYCIDPFGPPWLEHLGAVVLRKPIEACGASIVEMLRDRDLLFIDSSHVIRPQGDVVFEYLQLIPSLKNGVFVHVHDIFTPRDYLDEWLLVEKRFWNEQYLLEALLSNSDRYEVVLSNNCLYHDHPEEFKRACPYLVADSEPGSVYFRIA